MAKLVTIRKRGMKPLKFKGGALHEQLGVPAGQPIPPGKKRAALAGRYGPLAKKRAVFAFRGALSKGRKTAKKQSSRTTSAAKPSSSSKVVPASAPASKQWANAYRRR